MQFGDDDLTSSVERIQNGPQRKAHSKTSDQDARAGPDPVAGPSAEFLLGTALATVHQHTTLDADQEIVDITLAQLKEAIRRLSLVDNLPGAAQGVISLSLGSPSA